MNTDIEKVAEAAETVAQQIEYLLNNLESASNPPTQGEAECLAAVAAGFQTFADNIREQYDGHEESGTGSDSDRS